MIGRGRCCWTARAWTASSPGSSASLTNKPPPRISCGDAGSGMRACRLSGHRRGRDGPPPPLLNGAVVLIGLDQTSHQSPMRVALHGPCNLFLQPCVVYFTLPVTLCPQAGGLPRGRAPGAGSRGGSRGAPQVLAARVAVGGPAAAMCAPARRLAAVAAAAVGPVSAEAGGPGVCVCVGRHDNGCRNGLGT